jgi:hypothetical protein
MVEGDGARSCHYTHGVVSMEVETGWCGGHKFCMTEARVFRGSGLLVVGGFFI